jgi:hyperosmotically inducible periplasmic protein
MFKRMSVVICGVAVTLMTVGVATARTASPEPQESTAAKAKDKTQDVAKKTATVMTDAEITSAVKTKLLGDTKVAGLKIDVDTEHGVVTLTGPVKTTAEKTEALRLARTTMGVKSVHDKLVVENVATSGHSEKSTATKAKEKTEDAAEKTVDATKSGAKKTAAVLTDAEITSAVKTKFLADTQVGGLAINVDTSDHIVTLTGTVHSDAEKAEALRLARTTAGVHKVVSKLTVEPKK